MEGEGEEVDRAALARMFPVWLGTHTGGGTVRGFIVYARGGAGPDGQLRRKIRNTNKCAGTIRGAK